MKVNRKSIGMAVVISGLCVIGFFYGIHSVNPKNSSPVKDNQNTLEHIVNSEQSNLSEEIQPVVKEVKSILVPSGMTLDERFGAPEGYTKDEYQEESFGAFVRGYSMQKDGAKVQLYDGGKKFNQSSVAAVFSMTLGERDLQQCADSVIRMYAEYFYEKQEYERMNFHFVNGFECSYSKWMEGYRILVNGNDVSWQNSAQKDNSSESLEKYLNTVFSYASTISLNQECEEVDFSEVQIGDVFIEAGSPGHVVMVVDVCTNKRGEKAVLLAQGYMPAQEFHVIRNPRHKDDPWYYQEELESPFKTAEYTFDSCSVKRPQY